MSDLGFQHCEDAAAAAAAAAQHIALHARRRLRREPVFTLALSGGSTPRLMLEALAGLALSWSRIQVFQVDERIAAAGEAARNINMLHDVLIAPGLLPAANLHALPVEEEDREQAALGYAGDLSRITGTPVVLDMVHLGLGDDGHTASLVPGDPALESSEAAVALTEEYRGHRRMTLTYPVLNAARARLWLITGAGKAPMMARLAAGDQGIPAGRVRREASVVFTDLPLPR